MNATPPQLVSMESFSHRGDSFPAPPHYYSPDDKIGHQVRIYHIRSPLRHPSASSSFDFATGGTKSPPEGICSVRVPRGNPRTHVCRELRRRRLAPFPRCDVMSLLPGPGDHQGWARRVTMTSRFRLVLGCCLLPFLVNHFKDAHHCCPRCHRLLHVHRRSCYQ
ncbi:uncharacterized protein LOC144020594 isoform X3 [Festucalex cinctus]